MYNVKKIYHIDNMINGIQMKVIKYPWHQLDTPSTNISCWWCQQLNKDLKIYKLTIGFIRW